MGDGRVTISTETPPETTPPSAWQRLKRAIARKDAKALRKVSFSLLGVAALIFLLLYLQGVFGGRKVAPGIVPLAGQEAAGSRAVSVQRREIEDVLEWPGTVRSRTEVQVAPKLLARIKEIRVEVGTSVKADDVLAVLDDRDLISKVEQAKSALGASEAQAVQSEAEHRRVKGLFEKEAATARDLEAAQARARSARAQVDQARQAVTEAEVGLSESVLRAPFEGVITEKWAQAGDTAVPGKPLVTLQDPRRLRLEAHIPESCARKAALGMDVRVRIDSLGRETTGRIEEIAPVADPESRTFLLKASLAPGEGIRPGMFGRFIQPCGKKVALLVPVSAVTRSGQLEMVQVVVNGEAQTRHIRTGKSYGDLVEVLSGLREGEKILPEGK
jgi:RND family efflux transporter MFP subunit